MTHFGKAMGTILMSTTAIVSADYVKPWVAVMLPPDWLLSPPAVVLPQPRPDSKTPPAPAEKSSPQRPISPRTRAEPAPKVVSPPESDKRTKTRKPTPAPKPTAPPARLEYEPAIPRREAQRLAPPEPPAIRRDRLEQPRREAAPECWDDVLDEPCAPRRRTPPDWENDPPPPDWPQRFERRLDVPPPGWAPPPRAWRDWRGPGRRFDPERFGRWERRQWRYR